jgi:hypothetical protein
MKKPNMINFTFINPFKRGFYMSMIFKLSSYEYTSDYYFFMGFIFFQLEIDFKMIYLNILKIWNEKIL